MEKLRLCNGSEYVLRTNGIRDKTKGIAIEIIVPDGMTLEQIREEFNDRNNTQILYVVREDGKVLRMEEGYTILGSRLTLDLHAAIGLEVQELEDGGTETIQLYGQVAGLELYQETVESKVEANRADIDYLLMMQE